MLSWLTRFAALTILLLNPLEAHSLPEPLWLGADPQGVGITGWCPQPRDQWQCYNYHVVAEDLQAFKFRIAATWSDDKIQVKVNGALVWDEQINCSTDDHRDHFRYPNLDITSQLVAGDNEVCIVALCPCGCSETKTNGCIQIVAGAEDRCPELNLPESM